MLKACKDCGKDAKYIPPRVTLCAPCKAARHRAYCRKTDYHRKRYAGVSARRKQVYTMIGHEPFDVCMDRIRRVIGWGGEPYAQAFIKLNAIKKEPRVRHDWTPQRLRWVQRWVNRHLWRKTKFEDYDPSAKTSRMAA